jgi:hypothetical protein
MYILLMSIWNRCHRITQDPAPNSCPISRHTRCRLAGIHLDPGQEDPVVATRGTESPVRNYRNRTIQFSNPEGPVLSGPMAVRGTAGLRLGTIPSAKRRNHECNKVVEGEGEMLLLESGILKRAQIFSQEQDSRVKILGVYFISCEWATVS